MAPRPHWQVAALEAKRAALAALPEEQQEEARLAQLAARERFRERRAARKARTSAVLRMLMDGAKLNEIAAAIGKKPGAVRTLCASLGIDVVWRTKARAAPMFMISDTDSAALDVLAGEMGADRPGALAAIVGAALADGAHVARRVLGVKRKAA